MCYMKISQPKDFEWLAASHEDPNDPGVWKKVLFSNQDFDDDCGLRMFNYAKMEPEKEFALHYHETLEEVFYILEGEALIRVGEDEQKIGPGMAVLIPKKTKHWMKNIGDTDLIYLAFGASREIGETVSLE